MKTLCTILILSLTLSVGLSGCGRKNPPKAPATYVPEDGEPTDRTGDFKDYSPTKDRTIGNQP